MAHPNICWEDLQAGQVRDLGSVTPTREAIIAFATQFDPQAFHLDDEAARASVFGALCASGWHTCSMAMRLMVDHFLIDSSSLGSPGLENIQWHKPVFPGDTLRLRVRITDTRAMRSRPHVGMIRIAWEMSHEGGEKVLSMEGWAMFGRRNPAAPDKPAV
jgi:acyl dehydratase